jgi:flavin-binding protein dodecin
MAEHDRFVGLSSESLEAAANAALDLMPAGPEGLKRARIVEQRLQRGGIAPGTEYIVFIEDLGSEA